MNKNQFDIYAPYDCVIHYIGSESEMRNGKEYKSKFGLRVYAEIQSNLYPEMVMLFAHLSEVTVRRGQYVHKGQKIGVMGNTGTVARHLHFGLYPSVNELSAKYAIDPRELLKTGYPVCNTKQSGAWNEDYSHIHTWYVDKYGKPYLHAGVDFSGLQSNLIDGWEHDCDVFKKEFRRCIV